MGLLAFLISTAAAITAAQDAIHSSGIEPQNIRKTTPNKAWCKTPVKIGPTTQPRGTQADCSDSFTNPSAEYAPSIIKYIIPVVVHVMRSEDGTMGHISEETIRDQINVLNEDFLALPDTPGENGTNVNIEFYLATRDPNGNPTNGITYSDNQTWHVDGGAYYLTLAWDPDRYLNIYTADLGQDFLGYVNQPQLENLGAVGLPMDRAVVHYASFGRDDPVHAGRILTHEIGHYLGLYHPWHNGCQSAFPPNCYSTGDFVCDTSPQDSPNFGCQPSKLSCGNVDPIDNYMCYTDGICLTNFTQDQARRIRCTLINWRPDLFQAAPPGIGACCIGDGTCVDDLTAGECAGMGGVMLGNGTFCGAHPCPTPRGACCFGAGLCAKRPEVDCNAIGGDYQGHGTDCHPTPCLQTGGCCLGSGVCIESVTEIDCAIQGGQFRGIGSDCAGMADFDMDGAVDVCDNDDDNDGVLDSGDDCPLNTPGLLVDIKGKPLIDLNNDCNVDGEDMSLIVQELLK